MVERSKDWMDQAKRDLENANYELRGGYHEWACFLSQQAAEKAVKAALQRQGGEAFGHSVSGLIEILAERAGEAKRFVDSAKELDKAYIPTRYPNAHPQGPPFKAYTEAEASRLISHAGEIVRFCEGILSDLDKG